ncbi:MAG: HEAT repeat domain-containing protein [Myxococcales bacterium]|nr:HEAT repeat domain-containing protein [Myxococcales bacterium]
MELCAKAGRFLGFCFTHAVWNAPPDEAPLATWEALAAPFEAEDGIASLRARWWFNRYVGTGLADSAAAMAAPPESAAAARGAWAIEAIRLCDGDISCAHTGWGSTAPAGPVLAPDRRVGRYDLPFPLTAERALPSVPGFAGSRRLLGETPDEDLTIALLEGLWFREKSGASAFVAWLDDPRPRVRYTALRCFRSLPSPEAEAVLTGMRGDPDPIVAAHVEDALTFQTWKGKGNRPN